MPRLKKTKESLDTEEKKVATKKEKKVFAFSVDVVTSGENYSAEGDDLYSLLRDFKAPALINTETNITVTKGGKTIQRDLKVADARRCFAGYDTTSLELLAISITKQLPN